MRKVIGIDLGTTNACVSVMDGGEPVVPSNAEGRRTTPSVVAETDGGERFVGQIAKRQAIVNGEHTVVSINRFLGRPFACADVQTDAGRVPYLVRAGQDGETVIKIRGQAYAPQEIASMILRKMRETAEEYLGDRVIDAVISVPVHFNAAQRRATKEAGRMADLNVVEVVDEPTAAALAYGLDQGDDMKVAVYDLGGGTFDVSILEISDDGRVIEVLSSSGDPHLGGDDFDHRIIEHLVQVFADENDGVNVWHDRMALQRVKEAAEKAKHELSSLMETSVNLPFLTADVSGPKHLNVTLTRTEFAGLVEDLIQRTLESCRKALQDADLTRDQIDKVLLVGGQTRMPRVQQVVRDFFGLTPDRAVSADEVVAVGAAIRGGILSGDPDSLFLDVSPLSVGVETAGGVLTAVIPRHTPLPAKRSVVFSTDRDDQSTIDVHVLQGERPMAEDNMTLARLRLSGIHPQPRGVPQIEVTFDVEFNGIVNVSARDLRSGKAQQIKAVAWSGLSEDAIEEMVKRAEVSGEEDTPKTKLAFQRNKADLLIYTTEKLLADPPAVLGDDDANHIRHRLDALRFVCGEGDADKIRAARGRLESSTQWFVDVMTFPPGRTLPGSEDLIASGAPLADSNPHRSPAQRKSSVKDHKTTLETTRDNLAYAARVAGAQVLLDKILEVTVNHLQKAGVDTRLAESPLGRSLLKVALPTIILAAANGELLGARVDSGTLKTVRGLAEISQLAATLEGASVLARLAEPLLADLLAVRAALPAPTQQQLDELLAASEQPAEAPSPI